MKTAYPAIMAMPRLMKVMEQQLKMQALIGNKQDSVYSLLAERAAKATMATHLNENRFQKIFDEQRKFNEVFSDKYFPWLRQYNLNYIGSNRIIDELTKKHKQYQLFPNYIKKYEKDFSKVKVKFAKKVAPCITENDFRFDLRERIQELADNIAKWNKAEIN